MGKSNAQMGECDWAGAKSAGKTVEWTVGCTVGRTVGCTVERALRKMVAQTRDQIDK